MKVAVYSPYLDTIGGGEKYILTIAKILSNESQVDVLLDEHLRDLGVEIIKKKARDLLGLDLSEVNFIQAPLGKGSSQLKRITFLKKYDWLFYLTDGSIFLSTAKHNVIHFQVPFTHLPFSTQLDKIKRKSWDWAIFNSQFTADFILRQWQIKYKVIYPPVDTDRLKALEKKNYIVSVGRFFGFTKSKKHEVMIKAFQELADTRKIKGWSLHLVGGMGEGDAEYVESLKKLAAGYEIYFYPNLDLEELRKLYGESKIYWHAAGFGETSPELWEHFGITTVEAMASGCVPVVINLGGQREIVENSVSGFLWDNLKQMKEKTLDLIADEKLRKQMEQTAIESSGAFNSKRFKEQIEELVYGAR